MEKDSKKNWWKKFWFLLWKDDSLKGWIFSILFIFVFIKFIFFPVLTLATGTSIPLAIVESCSMYHKDNLFSESDQWWEEHEYRYEDYEINELDFKEFPLKNGFTKGDILFITKANPETLEEGDIIIFNAYQQYPVIHRIVDIKETGEGRIFSTRGDNNGGQLTFEENIGEDQIMGKAALRIAPYFGWVKLIFFEAQKSPYERGFCEER